MSQHRTWFRALRKTDECEIYYEKVREIYQQECMQALVTIIGKENFKDTTMKDFYFLIWLDGENLHVYIAKSTLRTKALTIDIRYWTTPEKTIDGFPEPVLGTIKIYHPSELINNNDTKNMDILKTQLITNKSYWYTHITIKPNMKLEELIAVDK